MPVDELKVADLRVSDDQLDRAIQLEAAMERMAKLMGLLVDHAERDQRRNPQRIQPWTVVADDRAPTRDRVRGREDLEQQLLTEELSQTELLAHIACAQLSQLTVMRQMLEELRRSSAPSPPDYKK